MKAFALVDRFCAARSACGVASLAVAALFALSCGASQAEAGGPIVFSRGGIAALNPQSLPPKDFGVVKTLRRIQVGSEVMLNPQPLPPRWLSAKNLPRPGDKVMLNPQPLPPKVLIHPYLLRLK